VLPRDELKKLERKAKSLLLTKEIPQGKVDVVRSILTNKLLLEEERFKTIIELLKNCSDKPQIDNRKIDFASKNKNKKEYSRGTLFGPAPDSSLIKSLYENQKKTGLFKIRCLAPSSGRFGITFKKRLIPSKKLLQLMRDVRNAQDKISVKLPTVLQLLIDDPAIDDATNHNYIRLIQSWLMECPLAALTFEQVKWMDRPNFESEIKNWCLRVFSFFDLDTGTKETIIQSLEGKLRETEELRKDEILPDDSDSMRLEKEKNNFARERVVYDVIMTLRSFLPAVDPGEGLLAKSLNTRYGIASLRDLSLLLLESLVYGREVTIPEIVKYYSVTIPKVSPIEWNASTDSVRRAGKDPESKTRRYLERLREQLYDFEELYAMLSMRYDSVDYVRKAFDDQWRVINKRRQDGNDIYERDFMSFLDECLSYFFSVFAPFLDGTVLPLMDYDGGKVDSAVFSPEFFQSELMVISNVQRDIFTRRSTATNNTVTRSEIKRIVGSQIPSMRDLENIMKQMSSSFYSIGKILQKVLNRHKETLKKGVRDSRIEPLRHSDFEIPGDGMLVIPYYDYRYAGNDKINPAQKMLVGTRIVNNLVKEGILNSINAFCFQFAQECFDRTLSNDLEYRKDLLKKIEEAERT
jgi:hypothetical protein